MYTIMRIECYTVENRLWKRNDEDVKVTLSKQVLDDREEFL